MSLWCHCVHLTQCYKDMAAYAYEERAQSHQFGVDIWFLLLQNIGGKVTQQLGLSLT